MFTRPTKLFSFKTINLVFIEVLHVLTRSGHHQAYKKILISQFYKPDDDPITLKHVTLI
jgi:hypothetical protein